MTLNPISTDDEGALYTCKTVSPYGSQERNVTIHVQGIVILVTKLYFDTFIFVILVPSSWTSIEITNTTNGDALHEQRYVLVCTVRLMTGMRIVPNVNWYYNNSVNGSIVETSEVQRITVNTRYSNSSRVITHILTFSTVLNDDGGVYSCRAQVTVPWMTTQPPVKQASVNMAVTSKWTFIINAT